MRPFHKAMIAALAMAAATAASAADYTAMYVFGDSLSDRGNLAQSLGGAFPNPPSNHSSFTNGPVAVEVVAQKLGLAADPSYWLNNFTDQNNLYPGVPAGTNYAVGGATAQLTTPNGVSPLINLPQQIGAYLSHSSAQADGGALYTIFIGGNDVRNATNLGGDATVALTDAVTNELGAIQALAAAGANNFLIVNLPDIGRIPEFALQKPADAAAATANSKFYNSLLSSGIAGLGSLGVTINQFDLFTYENEIFDNPAKYGLTDTTNFCYTAAPTSTATTAACGPNAENIGTMAFWNNVHPTGTVHALLGKGMLDTLGVSDVPEPATWVLLIGGFGMIGVALRTRRQPVAGHSL